MAKEIRHFGNVVAKPQNFNALLRVRKAITTFTEQSDFIAKNFRRLQKIQEQNKKIKL